MKSFWRIATSFGSQKLLNFILPTPVYTFLSYFISLSRLFFFLGIPLPSPFPKSNGLVFICVVLSIEQWKDCEDFPGIIVCGLSTICADEGEKRIDACTQERTSKLEDQTMTLKRLDSEVRHSGRWKKKAIVKSTRRLVNNFSLWNVCPGRCFVEINQQQQQQKHSAAKSWGLLFRAINTTDKSQSRPAAYKLLYSFIWIALFTINKYYWSTFCVPGTLDLGYTKNVEFNM